MLPRLALIELMFGISSVTARPDTLLPDGDQTESSAFKSWFGESKIVDEHGKPLVVYHGTRHEFSRFDIDKGQVGVHFSVSPEVANAFARSQGGEGGSVIPALIVRYTATLRVICVHGC